MSETTIWRILVVVAAVLVLIGNLAFWVDRSLADRDEFVKSARDEMGRQDVREGIAEDIVFGLMGNQPLLYQLAGPGAEVVVTQLLDSPQFQPLLDQVASGLYTMVTTGDEPTIVIETGFLQPIIAAIVATLGPAAGFSFQGTQLVIEPFARQDIPTLEWFVGPLQDVGILCGIAGLVILALSVVVAPNRPKALQRVALAIFAVAVVTLLGIYPLRGLYLSQIDDDTAHTIASGVADGFTVQLIVQTLLLLGAGVILWVAGLLWRGSPVSAPESQSPPAAPAA